MRILTSSSDSDKMVSASHSSSKMSHSHSETSHSHSKRSHSQSLAIIFCSIPEPPEFVMQGPSVTYMRGQEGALISLLARKRKVLGWTYYTFVLSPSPLYSPHHSCQISFLSSHRRQRSYWANVMIAWQICGALGPYSTSVSAAPHHFW